MTTTRLSVFVHEEMKKVEKEIKKKYTAV